MEGGGESPLNLLYENHRGKSLGFRRNVGKKVFEEPEAVYIFKNMQTTKTNRK